MQKAFILTEEEYNDLQDTIKRQNEYIAAMREAVKVVDKHDFKNHILVVDLDQAKLLQLIGYPQHTELMLFKK